MRTSPRPQNCPKKAELVDRLLGDTEVVFQLEPQAKPVHEPAGKKRNRSRIYRDASPNLPKKVKNGTNS